ncbi:MAG: hypothetical protein ACP6IS_10060 [Candidatus Asgardarchaeia archaeon]
MSNEENLKEKIKQDIIEKIALMKQWDELIRKLSPAEATKISNKIEFLENIVLGKLGEEKLIEVPATSPGYATMVRHHYEKMSKGWYDRLSAKAKVELQSLVDIKLRIPQIAITSTYLIGHYYSLPHHLASFFVNLFIFNKFRETTNSKWPAIRPLNDRLMLGMTLIDQPSTFEKFVFPYSSILDEFPAAGARPITINYFDKGELFDELPKDYNIPYVLFAALAASHGGIGGTLDNIYELSFSTLYERIPEIVDSLKVASRSTIDDFISHIFFGVGGTGKSLLLLSHILFGRHFILPIGRHNYRTQLVWLASDYTTFPNLRNQFDIVLLLAIFKYLQETKIKKIGLGSIPNSMINIVGSVKPSQKPLIALLPYLDMLIIERKSTFGDFSDNVKLWEIPFKESLATALLNFDFLDPDEFFRGESEGKVVTTEITNRLIGRIRNLILTTFQSFPLSPDQSEYMGDIKAVQVILTLPVFPGDIRQTLEGAIKKSLIELGAPISINVTVTGLFFVELPPAVFVRIVYSAKSLPYQVLRRLGILKGKTVVMDTERMTQLKKYRDSVLETLEEFARGENNADLDRLVNIAREAWKFIDSLS